MILPFPHSKIISEHGLVVRSIPALRKWRLFAYYTQNMSKRHGASPKGAKDIPPSLADCRPARVQEVQQHASSFLLLLLCRHCHQRPSGGRRLAESGNIPMEDITAKAVSSSPPLKKHKRSCHPTREREGEFGFGFCLAKKSPRAAFLLSCVSNRGFVSPTCFPELIDFETKIVPFFFLNAMCTEKWIEKCTRPFLPDDCGCDCDPGDDLFGKRDEIVSVAPKPNGPRPIVESWQFPFLAAFYGKGRSVCPTRAFLLRRAS